MTHTTEQERADFPSPALLTKLQTSTEGGAILVDDYAGGYDLLTEIWRVIVAYEAASRAPAVPVPQWDGAIKPADFIVDTFRRGGSGWVPKPDTCVRITHRPTGFFEEETAMRSVHANKAVAWQRLSDRLEALAAAPQPPEAAPVQLPEPIGYAHQGQLDNISDGYAYVYPMESPSTSCKLYTDQQVSAILAKHGIKTK